MQRCSTAIAVPPLSVPQQTTSERNKALPPSQPTNSEACGRSVPTSSKKRSAQTTTIMDLTRNSITCTTSPQEASETGLPTTTTSTTTTTGTTPTTGIMSEEHIAIPGDNDVLCGRGGSINSHKGNQQFHHLVAMRNRAYVTANSRPKRRRLPRPL
jgi:hypothetical protein